MQHETNYKSHVIRTSSNKLQNGMYSPHVVICSYIKNCVKEIELGTHDITGWIQNSEADAISIGIASAKKFVDNLE